MLLTILAVLITFFSFVAGVAFVPMHSILSMLLTYLCTGILFMYLGLEFMGLIYVVVYAGAIVILFIFILMLTNQPYKDVAGISIFQRFLAYAYTTAVLLAIYFVSRLFISYSVFTTRTDFSDLIKSNDLEAISYFLYDTNFTYVLIMAIVLFIALVSVVISTTKYKNTYAARRSFNKVYKIIK